jgi:uncharacterized membrane protein
MTAEPPSAPAVPRATGPAAAAAKGAEVFDEKLVCFLNEPFWRIEIQKDGQAACTETCDGPRGLRATAAQSVKGRPDAWSMDINGPDGGGFMSVTVRRTGKCTEELSSDQYDYEVSARRPHGPVYKGCCNKIGTR